MDAVTRRRFLRSGSLGLMAAAVGPVSVGQETRRFRISLAEWSLHRTLFDGDLDHLDFPRTSRELGIEGVEYVNQFFKDKAEDFGYLGEMRKRCRSEGVRSLILMVDGEGRLGAPDVAERRTAVDNHRRWIDAARFLGCHSTRVNTHSEGSFEEQQNLVTDGLRQLAEYSAERDMNVIVENHGGLSSNGRWLAGVMRKVDHERCGTLPDFGNFGTYGGYSFSGDEEAYDRYQGVRDLMPWAKGVSAKSHSFDAAGRETGIDYWRMMKIVLDAGYRGWVGVEYGGGPLPELEGIRKTRALLQRVRSELA